MAVCNAVLLYVPSITKIEIPISTAVNQQPTIPPTTVSFYLGNAAAVTANSSQVIKQYSITHVLELTDGTKKHNHRHKVPSNIILSQRLVSENIGDKTALDLLTVADQSIEFIQGCQQNSGTLLIHCSTGVSLSPAFVICYMIKECGVKSVVDAYDMIRKVRPLVDISSDQLIALEHGLVKMK